MEERYIKKSYIDEGSFSVCYKAIRKNDQTIVALKVVKPEKSSSHLEKEKEILTKIGDKEGIIKFIEFIPQDKCLVLEYFPSENMFNFVRGWEYPTEPKAKAIFKKIVMVIQTIHSSSVVHNDIKLENILLKDDEIKLIDFGLSFVSEKGEMPQDLRKAGSRNYLSPEKLDFKDDIKDAYKIDVWSLGIVLFSMLNKFYPYDPNDLAKRIQTEVLYPNIYVVYEREKFSKNYIHLVESMLTGDPKTRISISEILSHPWLQ